MKLLGIDGGATKISGWEVFFDENTNTFSLGDTGIVREYRDCDNYIADFVPESMESQFNAINSNITLTHDEKVQGEVYVKACADIIYEFSRKYDNENILFGIGMPGLKSKDRKGILAMANGPRIPDYIDNLKKILQSNHINLESNLIFLGSDADYCGIGEEYSPKVNSEQDVMPAI
ncbi:MAG: hypothetical protein R2771_09255 [Saprospiraceae bacterium]